VFCNHKCYSIQKTKNWRKENNPRWTGGAQEFECEVCKKVCVRQKHGELLNKYCSVECASKDRGLYQRGENHWNWKGGRRRYLIKLAPPKPDKCEVCGTLGSSQRKGLQYDHNHTTKKFRGWLCTGCNTTLGLVKENPKILKALIKYLKVNENLF